MFPEGKRASTDPPLTAETWLQTIHLLASQFTVYNNGSATAGTRDGCAGVIMTCGDRVDTAILDRSHLLGAVYTSSFAVAMQQDLEWATADHPGRSLNNCIENQTLHKANE